MAENINGTTPPGSDNPKSNETPVREAPASVASAKRARRDWMWWLPALLVLIVLRGLFIHGNPTDFPLDRNIGMAMTFRAVLGERADGSDVLPAAKSLLARRAEAPEFPFVRVWAVSLARMGLDPIVAARVFGLIASILTALGLAILGRRMGPPLLGTLVLWLFALMPLSVLMGRAIIPDTFMVAAMVWSIVAAGAGFQSRVGSGGKSMLWLSVGMVAALVVAALAKLPAIFFAPVAAVALMQAVGWRRWQAWVGVAAVAFVTYLAVCIWYRIAPWAPWVGLRRISENTNNLMASVGFLLEPSVGRVWFTRIVMALTLPGMLLAVVGWFWLQRRPGQRLWLNLWMLLSLLFVAVTLSANSYWIYPLVPVGCLLGAIALVEIRRSGWAMAVPLVLLVGFLWIDPSTRQVAEYLKTQPEYETLGRATDALPDGVNILYYGKAPQDLAYYSRRKGQTPFRPDYNTLRSRLKGRTYSHVLINHMQGDGIGQYLFEHWPVADTRPLDYVLYANPNARPLGEAVDPGSIPEGQRLDLDLAGALRVVSATALKPTVRPGGVAEIEVVFAKGPAWAAALPLTAAFIHEPTGESLPLAASRGGASFMLSMLPLLQTPDFNSGPTEKITYAFPIPRQMLAGDCRLEFSLLADRQRSLVRGESALTGPLLKVGRSLKMGSTPMEIDPTECLRLNPVRVTRLALGGGRSQARAHIASDSQLWMCPTLPPGDYELVITGRGFPVGMNAAERWPVLRVRQPGRSEEIALPFTSRSSQTLASPFKFYGSEDFLHLSILNPEVQPPVRSNWPLYMDDIAGGNRAIEIEQIEIRAVK